MSKLLVRLFWTKLFFCRLSEKDFEKLNFGLRSKLRRDSFDKLLSKDEELLKPKWLYSKNKIHKIKILTWPQQDYLTMSMETWNPYIKMRKVGIMFRKCL